MTEHAILNDLLGALDHYFETAARRLPGAGRALAVVNTQPYKVTVIVEGRDGSALQALEEDGDAALGNAVAALIEYALRHHKDGGRLMGLATAHPGAFRLLVDEALGRVALRCEVPGVGNMLVGTLNAVQTAH
jgi:hypothetical protein